MRKTGAVVVGCWAVWVVLANCGSAQPSGGRGPGGGGREAGPPNALLRALDADGDGIFDIVEGGGTDADGNGTPGELTDFVKGTLPGAHPDLEHVEETAPGAVPVPAE